MVNKSRTPTQAALLKNPVRIRSGIDSLKLSVADDRCKRPHNQSRSVWPLLVF